MTSSASFPLGDAGRTTLQELKRSWVVLVALGAYRLPFLAAAVLAGLSCAIFLVLPPYARNWSDE